MSQPNDDPIDALAADTMRTWEAPPPLTKEADARIRQAFYREDKDVVNKLKVGTILRPESDALVGTDPPSKANARQVGGEHYGLTDFQHWDMVATFELDYFQGQITKYVMRWRKKGGIRDLEKAQHFLEKYIELAGKGLV